MTDDLHLSGPTVTVFGDTDVFDAALSDELGRRGCSTHTVTTSTGWLGSVTHAVIRLDTRAGASAMEDLAARDVPAAHVVTVCRTCDDDAETARLDQLCRRCADHHDVSAIWHSGFELLLDDVRAEAVSPTDLAVAVADEIGHQQAWTSAPSFARQVFEPGRHRGHP